MIKSVFILSVNFFLVVIRKISKTESGLEFFKGGKKMD